MTIAVLGMLKTASSMLVNDGPAALLQAVIRKLRPVPNESDLAFDVLKTERKTGVMVDVGAHYGVTLKPFALAGWQVFAFEPDTRNREHMLERGFGKMPNVHIDSRGLADRPHKDVPLFRSDESSGISGFSAFRPTHKQCETVDVTTLELFVEEQGIGGIDFLKIDTEGFDLLVLKGLPWQRIRPGVILCEFEDRKTNPLGYNFHDLAGYLQDQGYQLIVSEWYPIERYGIEHDWRQFAAYPCELEDPDAWGNILAAEEPMYRKLLQACHLT